jgi:hypothetical protein
MNIFELSDRLSIRPLKELRMNLFEKGIAIWAVAIAAGGIWLYASSDRQVKAAATQSQPETQPPAVVQSSGASIIPEAKAAVQAGLRDPDSAQFRDVVVYGTSNKRTVCGSVNAKNGYGGYTGYYPFMYEELTKKVSSIGSSGIGGPSGQLIDEAHRNAIEGLCLVASKQGKATGNE